MECIVLTQVTHPCGVPCLTLLWECLVCECAKFHTLISHFECGVACFAKSWYLCCYLCPVVYTCLLPCSCQVLTTDSTLRWHQSSMKWRSMVQCGMWPFQRILWLLCPLTPPVHALPWHKLSRTGRMTVYTVPLFIAADSAELGLLLQRYHDNTACAEHFCRFVMTVCCCRVLFCIFPQLHFLFYAVCLLAHFTMSLMWFANMYCILQVLCNNLMLHANNLDVGSLEQFDKHARW